MKCPFCGYTDSKVIDSRQTKMSVSAAGENVSSAASVSLPMKLSRMSRLSLSKKINRARFSTETKY